MRKNKMSKFIVFEGIDGSGKGSALKVVAKHYPDCILTREPGGTPLAEALREVLLSPVGSTMSPEQQMDVFFGARRIHLLDKVYPALTSGLSVASDRFEPSTYAYQKVLKSFTKDEDVFNYDLMEKFFDLRERVMTTLPDAYFFLDVDPEEGMRRRASDRNQESNHFDLAGIQEQERRRRSYQIFFSQVASSETKCITIDANEPIHIVSQNVLREISAIFNS